MTEAAKRAEDDRKSWRVVSNVVGTIRSAEVRGAMPKRRSLHKRVSYARKNAGPREPPTTEKRREHLQISDSYKVGFRPVLFRIFATERMLHSEVFELWTLNFPDAGEIPMRVTLFQETRKGERFLYQDSGEKEADRNRILVFATSKSWKNLKNGSSTARFESVRRYSVNCIR